ncbi:MAG: M28 family metallopeptidase [Nannocystaceae bacterium]|nr:M28 family metallopeptidase [Nannocystaceae bacterium]
MHARANLALLAISLTLGCRHALDLPQTAPPAPSITVAPTLAAPAAATDVPATVAPEGVARVLDMIDPAQLRATVDRLAGFGTRHTLSDQASAVRGIGAARRWIEGQLQAAATPRPGAPTLQVALDPHAIAADGKRIDRAVDVVNVVATLPGTRTPQALWYVVAHYDSRASDPMDRDADAPGANDDGSGVALLLELARVLAPRHTDATLVFLATAGEEQGLVGARAHARAARERGLDIRGVLSFDIVGDPTVPGGPPQRELVRVFSEGLPLGADAAELAAIRAHGGEHDARSRQLARHVATLARWHALAVQPRLVFRPDRFGRGGDHTAFAEQGFAAIRFTEPGEDYDRQHQDVRREGEREFGDVAAHVDPHYLADVTRTAAAALLHLANAPSEPGLPRIELRGLGHDTTLTWTAAPEADVAGYEVVWRETTAASWQHVQDVGTGTRVTLPLHVDDWHFGVRSYDGDGWRSPVAPCRAESPGSAAAAPR